MNVQVEAGAENQRVFGLNTATTTYAFALDDQGLLRHLHWGPLIRNAAQFYVPAQWNWSENDRIPDITPEEYPVHGQFRYKEQCLSVTFIDGTRELRPEFAGHTATDTSLVVHLLDDAYGVAIDLHYEVLAELDLINRWATITNAGKEPFTITNAASAQFHVPYENLQFRNVHGFWGAEQQPFVQRVTPGKLVVESRRGISTHGHNPYFILDRDATEDHGEVWFGALALSGNFKGIVEQTTFGDTSVQYGLNDYDWSMTLQPQKHLTTPTITAGYTNLGLASMTHRMHRYGRSLMHDPRPRKVLYNSWEATGFTVTADNQIALADRAHRIGAELFVVDDGWFGRRDSDTDGLGDWWVNPDKFPAGLQPLIDHVAALGMQFGIWVEPEMVNPNSDLYREHPDWVYRDLRREPETARNQLVLNLTLPEVRQFVFDMVHDLLSEYEIDYLKWDANRPMSQVGTDQDVYRRHITSLYDIVSRLKAAHPHVVIEACASGGGRIDMGALSVFDDFWTSDNTDAKDRLDIQAAYSLMHPIKAMRAWVTDSPNFLTQRAVPLDFRFRVAMMGTLGIGADLTQFSEDELAESHGFVEQYKQLRPTIQDGSFYRLDNPSTNDYRLFQYAREQQSVLFAFLPNPTIGRRMVQVRLRGLDPQATYRFEHDWRTREKSGEYLMNRGINLWLLGDYASSIITFDRV